MKNSEWIDLEKLEQLMQSKSYTELSHEEKEWVSQWVESVDEYDALRTSETRIRQYFLESMVNSPDEAMLEQLTSRLKKKVAKQKAEVTWQFKPSISTWSIAVLFGCLGWWIGQSTTNTSTADAVQSIIIRDTIYLVSQPDTVFTERTIYKDPTVILARSGNTIQSIDKSSGSNGVNMKEKEELEKLLVSGTD